MELNQLEGLLGQGQIEPAVNLARRLLEQAAPGEVELGLRSCSAAGKPKVAALMRDLLNRYPTTLLGCPMMMYAIPESEYQRSLSFELPTPSSSMLEPLDGVRFLGYASVDDPIRMLPEDRGDFDAVRAPLERMVCRVAVFESVLDENEAAIQEMPGLWWAALLGQAELDVRIHLWARLLMPYTDAIEAGRCAQASAQGRGTPTRGFFVSDDAWRWAWNEGVMFKESCRGSFPHANVR